MMGNGLSTESVINIKQFISHIENNADMHMAVFGRIERIR
jgi:hypothetical protein